MTDLIQIYNPANTAALTDEQIAGLQTLTIEEIKQLATAYPNSSNPNAYLLIIDKSKPAKDQLPQSSSWPNLYNLIARNGLKNYVAFHFKGSYKPVRQERAQPLRTKARRSEVVDLGEKELMSLPGFKAGTETIKPEQIEVKKVRKTRKVATKTAIEATPSVNSNNK